MSNMSIETAFGTLDNDQLTSLRSGVKEISVHLSRIDGEKEQVKDIVNNLFDELKIPKKIINRIAKVYHKNSFSEVVVEDNEFQSIYSTVVDSN